MHEICLFVGDSTHKNLSTDYVELIRCRPDGPVICTPCRLRFRLDELVAAEGGES